MFSLARKALDRRVRARILADRDHAELAVVAMRRGEPVERRQFLDAGRAPGRPQIDQHRHALELGEADLAAVGIVEHRRGRGLALVAAVDALDRAGFGLGCAHGWPVGACGSLLAAAGDGERAGKSSNTHGRRA